MGELIDLMAHLHARAARHGESQRKRDRAGRYAPDCSVEEDLEKLKRVAQHAQKTQFRKDGTPKFKDPWDVTQRGWIEAADALEPELGWLGRPNGIVAQLRRETGKNWGWSIWLLRTFSTESIERFALSLTRRAERDADISDAFRSMLLVTAQLGRAPSGKPEYDSAYNIIRADAAAGDRLAYSEEQLLDSERVLALCETWSGARALIGAEPLGPKETARRGTPIEHAGLYFYCRKGVLPQRAWLSDLAAKEKFSVDYRLFKAGWPQRVELIRETIIGFGLPEPPPYGTRPSADWKPLPVPIEIELIKRGTRDVSPEQATQSGVDFLRWVAEQNAALTSNGRRLLKITDRTYRTFCTGNRDAVCLEAMKRRHGPLKPFLTELASEHGIELSAEARGPRRIVELRPVQADGDS